MTTVRHSKARSAASLRILCSSLKPYFVSVQGLTSLLSAKPSLASVIASKATVTELQDWVAQNVQSVDSAFVFDFTKAAFEYVLKHSTVIAGCDLAETYVRAFVLIDS